MNKFLFFTTLLSLFACDDGDLQIEIIDFDSATIQNCDAISVASANVLFKLNSTEALILELPDGAIANEITEAPPTIYLVSASGPAKITYRTFSDDITNAYFCSEVPVATPTVVEEIIAEGGQVLITTTLNADKKTFEHQIELAAISFITAKDTRITNLSIDNFGTVTTTLPEEEE